MVRVDADRQELFELLVSADGVGPSTAARIVAVLPTIEAICDAGLVGLEAIRGVGDELAAKVLEIAAPSDPRRRPSGPPLEERQRRRSRAGLRAPVDKLVVPPPEPGRCVVCRNAPDDGDDADTTVPFCSRHRQGDASTGGAHGLGRAERGCRCTRCAAALAKAAHMVDLRVAGFALEDIGDRYGVTRERARQLTERVAPWRPWVAVADEARAVAAEVVEIVAAVPRGDCPCCGDPVTSTRRTVCSDRCAEIHAALRRHVDPEAYAAHRAAVARWDLRRQGRRPSGTAGETPSDRSQFLPGSLVWAHAITALRAGWPVTDLITPEAARQLWRWHDRHPDDDPYDHVVEWASDPRLGDAKWLRDRYVRRRWTLKRIAEEVGCSTPTVARALRRHRIRVRRRAKYPRLHDREWLAARAAEGRSDAEVGELAGGATAGAVHAARREWQIPAGLPPHRIPPPLD